MAPRKTENNAYAIFWGEKLKTMLMQYFGVTNKEHYGMLWYFLEWSIAVLGKFFAEVIT